MIEVPVRNQDRIRFCSEVLDSICNSRGVRLDTRTEQDAGKADT